VNFYAIKAIFCDTLRETLSSKIFYILMMLSLLLCVPLLGLHAEHIDDESIGPHVEISYLFWDIGSMDEAGFQMVLVNIMGTLANSLGGTFGLLAAIVVTGSFVPRLFQPGSIELYLSRPVRRLEVLLAKYMGGIRLSCCKPVGWSGYCLLL